MVNEEIFGGLKSALERGESLKRAMMTLYSSGYKKEEIEECARMLVRYKRESEIPPVTEAIPPKTLPELQVLSPPIQPIQETKPQFRQLVPLNKPTSPIQKTTSQTMPVKYYPVYIPVQRVSDYEGKITPREKAIILILVVLLVFLIVCLGLIFLFKQAIINFFSNFFG